MSDFNQVYSLAVSGAADDLQELASRGGLEGFSPEQKRQITLGAAGAGQSAVLRRCFQSWHLYSTDPDGQGRSILHHAAASGDAETVRFAMDVLGFDPLEADLQGITPLDLSAQAPRKDAYAFLTARLGFSLEQTYRNPLLRGFHPDPSIVRVGEDYFLVNSSFVFFPGLPIYHSRDLVHWTLVGHAADDLKQSGLAGLPGGYGYWAPDISFFNGRFWVVATLRRDTVPYRLQMITSAENPAGPWSEPKFLPLDGIDPSLFADTDGRRYILLNPGAILAEIDPEGNLISEPEMIYFGSARIKPEGPHLLRKDGWYYLFLAEGGTGPDHMETVMRSRTLRGPYEACPFNPILSRKNPFSPVGRSGHGKLVSTPDGRWYMVYLCGRTVEGRTVMGRETALDPVTWTADGWPIVNGLKGPSCLQKLPFPEAALPPNREATPDWISPRADFRNFASFCGNRILLRCGSTPSEISGNSLLLLRQTEACFTQSARVDMTQAQPGEFGGLCGYYDERSYFLFGLRKGREGCTLEVLEQVGAEQKRRTLCAVDGCSARLSVEGTGLRRSLFRLHESGKELLLTLSADYLSDEGLSEGKRFTGAALGLAAVGDGGTVLFDEMRKQSAASF